MQKKVVSVEPGEIGPRLRKIRRVLKLSQKTVGEKIEMPQEAISNIASKGTGNWQMYKKLINSCYQKGYNPAWIVSGLPSAS